MPSSSFAPVQFGKYTLVERIASGGMAEVYKAVMRGAAGFEKVVALKRILPIFNEEHDFIQLFQDEARTASTLNHANLVQTFDFGEEGGSYYLALELVEGADLSKLCERLRQAGQPFPTATAAFVIAEAARGLAYAHEKRGSDGTPLGIVHRDVSPQNILVSYAGEVKIADFGIAKAASKVHRTMTGMVMGKLKYMSPEQVAGDNLDARTDVFSLGVILYELLTGGTLFPEAGSAVAELIHAAPIPPPSARAPGVAKELDEIVMKALGRPREKRYARAADLARDLNMWVNQSAPGFTREDLAALVARIYPPAHGPHTRSGTVLGSGVSAAVKPPAVIVPSSPQVVKTGPEAITLSDGDQPAVLTAALRKKPPSTPPPEMVRTPSGGRLIANPQDPHVDPRAQTEMHQPGMAPLPPARPVGPPLGATDTDHEPIVPFGRPAPTQAGAGEPAFVGGAPSRLDSGFDRVDRTDPARPARAPQPAKRRGPSTALVVSLVLVAVILGSGALVLLRFVLPGQDAAAFDAGAAVVAAEADAGGELAAAFDASAGDAGAPSVVPFQLTATLVDPDEKKRVADEVSDSRVTRRGVPDPDYELLLEALDFRVAHLTLAPDGRAEAATPLPMALGAAVSAAKLERTLAALTDYVRRTGELPPAVRTAALRYLRGRPAWDAKHAGRPIAIATLAVWIDEEQRARRLVELAQQNDALGRWCEAVKAPRRHFAPVGCEAGALAAELRASGGEAEAQAIERWHATPAGEVRRAPWKLTYLAARWDEPGPNGRVVSLQIAVDGGPRPPDSAFSLLVGGTSTPAPIAPQLGGALPPGTTDVGASDAGAAVGEAQPALVFVVPTGAFAPVLKVELAGGPLFLRLPPPPR